MRDPIVEEVHKIREELLARFNNDLDALLAHAKEQAEREGRTFVSRPPRKPMAGEPVRQPDKQSDAA
jgi:hypothetical protein